MRLTREMGQTGARRAVEAKHQEETGRFEAYSKIAADLFDDHPTGEKVRAEIIRRYGVTVAEKTASDWINRGLAARREAIDRETVAA